MAGEGNGSGPEATEFNTTGPSVEQKVPQTENPNPSDAAQAAEASLELLKQTGVVRPNVAEIDPDRIKTFKESPIGPNAPDVGAVKTLEEAQGIVPESAESNIAKTFTKADFEEARRTGRIGSLKVIGETKRNGQDALEVEDENGKSITLYIGGENRGEYLLTPGGHVIPDQVYITAYNQSERDELVEAVDRNPYWGPNIYDNLEIGDTISWELAYTRMGEAGGIGPIIIPREAQAKVDFIRSALQKLERWPTKDFPGDIQEEITKAQTLLRAIHSRRYMEKIRQQQAINVDDGNFGIWEKLQAEWDARIRVHNLFSAYRTLTDVEQFGKLLMEQDVTPTVLDPIPKIEEVGVGLNLLEEYSADYVSSLKSQAEMDAFRARMRGEMADRLQVNIPQAQRKPAEDFEWARELAERFFHITCRAASYEYLVPNGKGGWKKASFAEGTPAPTLNDFIFRMMDTEMYAAGRVGTMNPSPIPELFQGVDFKSIDLMVKNILPGIVRQQQNEVRRHNPGLSDEEVERQGWLLADQIVGAGLEEKDGKYDWAKKVRQLPNGSRGREYIDLSHLDWSRVSLKEILPTASITGDWAWGIILQDKFRAAAIAPTNKDTYLRNPNEQNLFKLLTAEGAIIPGPGESKPDQISTPEQIIINFARWAGGQISADTGAPAYSETEISNIVRQAAALTRGEEAGNQVPLIDGRRVKIVLDKALEEYRKGRSVVKPGVGKPDRIDQPSPAGGKDLRKAAKSFVGGFVWGFIKGLFKLG